MYLLKTFRYIRALVGATLLGLAITQLPVHAQETTLTQTVRGVILDEQAETPLPGATILLLDTTRTLGANADAEGRFVIQNVPVGRRSFRVTFVGYEPRVLRGVLIGSGKEVVLTIKLQEELMVGETVEITAERQKAQPLNEMATVSARSFSVEEAERYANGINDPSRMARNFAGVSGAGDFANSIVIRGNSPNGLLWRFEGIDVFNPNHFANQGTNGGPVSILNSNVLANSDFLTGAFPAEYGNATSGVFDLKMRSGNSSNHEFMFQIGFNGLELMAEGPISRESGASYLASYRYSTLAVFDALGIQFGDLTGIPYYQDLNFKVDLPAGKLGKFSVFGMGGISTINILESELSQENWEDPDYFKEYQDVEYGGGRGVVGLSHTKVLNEKTFVKTTLVYMHEYRALTVDSLRANQSIIPDVFEEKTDNGKLTLASFINRKFNARHTVKAGFFLDHLTISVADSGLTLTGPNTLERRVFRNESNSTQMLQVYAQWLYRINRKLTLNAGLHFQHLFLNNSQAVEPRVGLKYQMRPRHALSLGYGLHSQIQAMAVYFYRNEAGAMTNQDLGMTRSHHVVLGYDYQISQNLRTKVETYVQLLNNVPVEMRPSYNSMLNYGAGFFGLYYLDSLVNEGTGYNYGVELTLEKYLSDNYYFLLTASLFNSRYEGSDGIERNTAFNSNYVINALVGTDIPLNKANRFVLTVDFSASLAGGLRYVPVDIPASLDLGNTIYDTERAYEPQTDPYFRPDIRVGLRMNGRKISQEFALNIQNFINYENEFFRRFDPQTGRVAISNQIGFFPVVQYRIQF